MPYIKQEDRTDNITNAISVLVKEISVKGDLNYVICELVGKLIVKDGISYTTMSNWIDTLPDAEAELRRRLLDLYENLKIKENGDVPSFEVIIRLMKG